MRLIVRITKRNATKEDRNRIEAAIEKALAAEKDLQVNVELGD